MRIFGLLLVVVTACGRPSLWPPDKPQRPANPLSTWDMGEVIATSVSEDDTIALRHAIAPTLDGQGTVVAWLELAPSSVQQRLSLAVLTDAGEPVIYQSGLVDVPLFHSPDRLTVLATSTGYLIYYNIRSALYSVRLDADGKLRDHIDFGSEYATYRVLPAAQGHAILSTANVGGRRVRLQLVNDDGSKRGDSVIVAPSSSTQFDPDAVWLGDDYLVVFQEVDGSANRTLSMARFDSSGVPIGSPTTLPGRNNPRIYAFSDDRFLVVEDHAHALLVDAVGTTLWADEKEIDHPHRLESFTSAWAGGDGVFMTWESDTQSVFPRIVGATVRQEPEQELPPVPEVAFSSEAFACLEPVVTMGQYHLAVAFQCDAGGARRVFLVQVPR